ncbi:MAG: ABC transporter permease [Chloroflexi bacterium]|nr:ABC transporter permease [Chloroflexota bacterium]
MVAWDYIAKRLLFAFATFLIASSAAFFIMSIIPGDIAYRMLGDFATPKAVAELRQELGVDQPVAIRYVEWLGNLLRGDLGGSAYSQEPIVALLSRKLDVTLELAFLATMMGVVFGVPAGMLSAIRPGSWLDAFLRPASILGLAAPSFWVGLLLLLLPSTLWNYAPPRFEPLLGSPLRNLQLMVPASAVIGFAFMASISRVSRTTMLEVVREDYIRTAFAKGLSERTVVFRHALRNALIPILTLVSLQFAALLGGTVIVEQIFSLPGLGQQAIAAINTRDYPVVQGFVVFMVLVYVTVNLVLDVATTVLDPRIRFA